MKLGAKPLQAESDEAIREFQETFGCAPEFVAVAPGRVNLIGEHTDYNLLPVLPMTLDRGIRIFARARPDALVRIANRASEFPGAQVRVDAEICPCPGEWTNYVLAALNRVQLETRNRGGVQMCGMDILVDSNLPPAAGLSSSSALVIATCLASLQANGISWTQRQLAKNMTQAEQFVGTAGGGMDQAAISLAERGSALLVEFDPLHTEPIALPAGLAIYIINSGQRAEKTGAARFGYNRRSLECGAAVAMLARAASGTFDTPSWVTLRDVYDACRAANKPWSELLLRHLPTDPPDAAQVQLALGESAFNSLCEMRHLDISRITEWLPGGRLQLFERASHVLGEADRVYAFREAMRQNDLAAAAHVANSSHVSCRDLYHISTPELERLVAIGRQSGAAAVRITGAGFGGCLVAFVASENAPAFASKMMEQGLEEKHLIEARPGGHAHVVRLEQ